MTTHGRFRVATFVALVTLSACNVLPTSSTSAPANAVAELPDLRADVATVRADVKTVLERLEAMEQRLPPVPASQAQYTIDMDDDPRIGSDQAPIGIVEFSDFQCPFCRRFHETTFLYLKKEYIDTGKVRFVYRDVPLAELHPQAEPAAIAANCADQQGAFWPYAAALFSQQDDLDEDTLRQVALDQKLDVEKFDTCRKDPTWKAEIHGDQSYAQVYGVEATPSFFVGRIEGNQIVDAIPLAGAVPFPYFVGAIESLLRKSAAAAPEAPLASR